MSVIYLDPSAIGKLVVEEPESAALAAWLDAHDTDLLVTSALSRVELIRAARRRSPDSVPAALSILAELSVAPIDATVLDMASQLDPAALRTLDVLHLATAATLGTDLLCLVAYDDALLDAAGALGLPVEAPR